MMRSFHFKSKNRARISQAQYQQPEKPGFDSIALPNQAKRTRIVAGFAPDFKGKFGAFTGCARFSPRRIWGERGVVTK
jgi:hypothetical protein